MPKRRLKRHSVTQPSDPSYRLIPLTQGKNTIVDTEDFAWLSQWNWFAQWGISGFYAVRNESRIKISMHRVILHCRPGEDADHKNHDTLDNRKRNLRRCSHAENCRNHKRRVQSNSGYKGVRWIEQCRKWMSRIMVNRKAIYLGLFKSSKKAAHAYDEAAKRYHGEFAYLNFPQSESLPRPD